MPQHNLREGLDRVNHAMPIIPKMSYEYFAFLLSFFSLLFHIYRCWFSNTTVTTVTDQEFSWVTCIPFRLEFFSQFFFHRKKSTFIPFNAIVKYARNRLVSDKNNNNNLQTREKHHRPADRQPIQEDLVATNFLLSSACVCSFSQLFLSFSSKKFELNRWTTTLLIFEMCSIAVKFLVCSDERGRGDDQLVLEEYVDNSLKQQQQHDDDEEQLKKNYRIGRTLQLLNTSLFWCKYLFTE